MNDLFQLWVYLAASPLLWLLVTVLAYLTGVWLFRISKSNPLFTPVLVGVVIVVSVLLVTGTPYPVYFEGAKFVHFLIGPATVALAVPLYSVFGRLKTMLRPLLIALFAGALTSIGSAIGIAWALGASRATLMSLAPKSVTMPIAMGVAERIGGIPSLAAVAVAVTGISGAMMARGLLNRLRIEDMAVRGFAAGLAAHAVGTARAHQIHPDAGAFAALAMGLNGIVTALLLPLLVRLSG